MKTLKTRDVALVGLFAALTVICAWISMHSAARRSASSVVHRSGMAAAGVPSSGE